MRGERPSAHHDQGAALPAARHPTSGTTRLTHRAGRRTPPATSPTRSGTRAACVAPRRHTTPSVPAAVKRGVGAYFSQPIFGDDRSLCSLHIRRGNRAGGRNRRILSETGAPGSDGYDGRVRGIVDSYPQRVMSPQNRGNSSIEVSGSHLEQPVDELNLLPNIRAAHPPRLPFPNHVHARQDHPSE